MRFQIIFVRHAESCANVWQAKYPGSQITYHDPEITRRGILRSKRMFPVLSEFITQKWSDKPYTIGASIMIRAQMTAFWMLAKNGPGFGDVDFGRPINIFPHIAEEGIGLSNMPMSKEEQRKILSPEIGKLLDGGIDSREQQTIWTKSDMRLFLEWMQKNQQIFKQGDDGIYRAVIFTHGNFLRSSFKVPYAMRNNGFIYTEFAFGEQPLVTEFAFPRYYINNTPIISAENIPCPDGCRQSVCGHVKEPEVNTSNYSSCSPCKRQILEKINLLSTRKIRGGAKKKRSKKRSTR